MANAGPDQFTQTLTAITFNGGGSSDPGGTIASYAWTFGDGASGSGVSVSHAYATAGSYTVTLTVTDNGGLRASDTALATIADRPPVANAGPNLSASVGTAVTLNGSGSSDPDGTITAYSWTLGDGASGSGMIMSHAYAAAGVYSATLTVTDNNGAQASDTALVTVTTASGSGQLLWGQGFGGIYDEAAKGVATDGSGNALVGGTFVGTGSFGGRVLTSLGQTDVFIAKYSGATGLWGTRFGGTGHEDLGGVAVDASGNVFAVGRFSGTVSVATPTGTKTLTSVGYHDVFVVKLAGADGSVLWANRGGGSGEDYGNAVAVTSTGDVVITGCNPGSAIFGGATLGTQYEMNETIIAKYAGSDGHHLASRGIGGSMSIGDNCGYGVAVDGAGNILLTGYFAGNTVDFGGGVLPWYGANDIYVAKLLPDATWRSGTTWAISKGVATYEQGNAIAVDGVGDVYVTGYITGAVNLGGGPLTSPYGANTKRDAFLAKFTGASGAHVWSTRYGAYGGGAGSGVAVDRRTTTGDVIVAAGAIPPVLINGVTYTGTASTAIVARYSTSGTPRWVKTFEPTPTTALAMAQAVACDGSGNALVGGYFTGTINLGAGPLLAAGADDALVFKLAP